MTQKYQARCIVGEHAIELVTNIDTALLAPLTNPSVDLEHTVAPVSHPSASELLTIESLFKRLSQLVGVQFKDSGYDQERNRGAELHRLVCEVIGYVGYQDDGQFPDIRHQLLEVKLQTSPTIDLGLVRPDSADPLDVPQIHGQQIRHCDVRYAIFYGHTDGNTVTLTHLFLTTGETFFKRFPQFQGKVLNHKLQISLPSDFFDT